MRQGQTVDGPYVPSSLHQPGHGGVNESCMECNEVLTCFDVHVAGDAGLLVVVAFERRAGVPGRRPACGYVELNGIGEPEADDSFRLDLNLLAAGNGVGTRADPAAGCRADRGTLASAYDGAEDGTHCRAAANFFGGVLAAGFALFGEGLGCTGNVLAFVVDRGQRDGEQRAALVVLGILRGVDMAGDLSALLQHDHE